MPGLRRAFLGTAAAVVIAWIVRLWLFSDAAWLHPELLGSSYYVWFHPESDTLWDQVRRVVDWKAFDPNVNRVRPLNDVFEVIDAIARPHLTNLFGPKPALLPSALLTMSVLPVLLFGWLRAELKAWEPALVLTLLLLASPAFLSVTVASMHPAKRICLVLFAAALYLARRHEESGKGFPALLAVLMAGFLTDEAALAAYPVIAALYWPGMARHRARLIAFLCLPIAFLAIAKWALPAIYLRLSVHGAWDALSDPRKLMLFRYLLVPEFYVAAARQTARSILSMLGIATHVPATEIATLVAVGAAAIWHVRSRDTQSAMAVLALTVTSVYATLLDWYPFPHEISYLGSFNYYYHSFVALIIVAWLAVASRRVPTPFRAPVAFLVLVAAVANLALFERVNRLVAVIHLYPYSNANLVEALASPGAVVSLRPDPAGETARFESTLHETFGDRWQENGFYRTHQLLKPTPLMGDTQIRLLFRAFYPHLDVESLQFH